mmetsp:Transcript_24976/g.67922  ORF Transcript_24976/g.67922 Transcript_24976/m.67922 type:complete len:89 (+) Transcript_24976:1177-1443(+)|eukprot:1159135-Pelagomonas_calceolata.AAC.3
MVNTELGRVKGVPLHVTHVFPGLMDKLACARVFCGNGGGGGGGLSCGAVHGSLFCPSAAAVAPAAPASAPAPAAALARFQPESAASTP